MARLKKETEEKILAYLSAALIAFLAFSASLFIVLVDRSFYDKSFQQYGAYDKIGVEGIRFTADAIIDYLVGYSEDTSAAGLSPFTKDEKSHMQDVHSIFNKVKYLSIISILLLAIAFLRMRANGTLGRDVKKILKYSGIKILAALAAVYFFSVNFGWFFTKFHYVFFPQGNWQFPVDSLLIIMFPQEFFQDYLARMFVHILIFGLILLASGIFLGMKGSPKKKARRQ